MKTLKNFTVKKTWMKTRKREDKIQKVREKTFTRIEILL